MSAYDPAWPHWFEQLRTWIWPAVEPVGLRIDHVGSTAVQGLAAKPIVDMHVVVGSEDDIAAAIELIEGLGYRWLGDLGVSGRQAFRPEREQGRPPHHLYLVVDGNRAHLDHVLLRDLPCGDEDARRRYGDVKRRAVEVAHGDIDVYLRKKAPLVAELLTRARGERGLEPVEYWLPEDEG